MRWMWLLQSFWLLFGNFLHINVLRRLINRLVIIFLFGLTVLKIWYRSNWINKTLKKRVRHVIINIPMNESCFVSFACCLPLPFCIFYGLVLFIFSLLTIVIQFRIDFIECSYNNGNNKMHNISDTFIDWIFIHVH